MPWTLRSTLPLVNGLRTSFAREAFGSLATDFKKRVAVTLGLALAYYALARLGLQFQFAGSQASPVWPPSGLALAAVLLWGYRATPGIYLGALCANITDFYIKAGGSELVGPSGLLADLIARPEHFWISAVIGIGNTIEALFAAGLVRKFHPGADPFVTVRGVLLFCVATLIACALASTLGVSALFMGGILAGAMFKPVWFTWWLGDVTGIIIVTPFVVSWWSLRSARVNYNSILLAAVALIVLFVFSQMIFIGLFDVAVLKKSVYLVFPILLLIAFRFGAAAATLGILVTSASAIISTLSGSGPFSRADQTETLIVLEGFVSVASMTVLFLDATISERSRALADSIDALEQFRSLFKGSPNALLAVDGDGVITQANGKAEKTFGYPKSELVGKPIEILVPESVRFAHARFRAEFEDRPSARPMAAGSDLFGQRKDGSPFPVEIALNPLKTSTGMLVLATVVDITERKRAEERLSAALVERDELRWHFMQAQELERQRLARDLHDQTGQVLTAALLELKGVEIQTSENGRVRLRQLRRRLEDIERSINRVAWELRPASIDELGLASALSNYVSEWTAQYHIEADFHCRNTELEKVGDDARTTLYRVAQEALTNVVKHAHGATAVSVIIDRAGAMMQLTIDDNGCGFNADDLVKHGSKCRGGHGIAGMRERLLLVGGELEIESSTGVGTTVFARVPLTIERLAA